MTRLFFITLITFLFPVILQAKTHGEFVKTGNNVYQYLTTENNESSTQVVVTAKGIYLSVQRPNNRVALAEFDPAKLELGRGSSLFVAFNDLYNQIITIAGTYSLKGSGEFEFPGTGVTVYIDRDKRFCGIVKRPLNGKGALSMLALVNNKVVGTISDPEIADVLLQSNAREAIGVYSVAPDGTLSIQSRKVTTADPIGLSLQGTKNPCRSGNLKFMKSERYEAIKGTKDEAKAKELIESSLTAKNPLDSIISVIEDRERIVGFDTSSGTIVSIRPVGRRMLFCVIEETPL